MVARVLVAVVCIPLIIGILLFCPPICLPIALAILNAIAAYELLWATGAVPYKRMVVFASILAGAVPFWYYFDCPVLPMIIALFLLFIVVFAEAIGSDQQIKTGQMGIVFFGALLIPMMLSTFVRIADLEHSNFLVLLPFVSAFTSDAFALFAGVAFGKHKLAPKLSPKKTVEGSAGGFAGCILCCVVYGAVVQMIWDYAPNYGVLVLYGLLASLVSQLGDLSFSYIKREYDLKDYGHLLPGHGGVLDRFDSVIFSAPLTMIMVTLLPFFRF